MFMFLWDSADQNYIVSSDLTSLPLPDQGYDGQPLDQSALPEVQPSWDSLSSNKHTSKQTHVAPQSFI